MLKRLVVKNSPKVVKNSKETVKNSPKTPKVRKIRSKNMKNEARNTGKSDLEMMFEKMRKRKEEKEALSGEVSDQKLKVKEMSEDKEAKENKSNIVKEIKRKFEIKEDEVKEEEVKNEIIVKSRSEINHFQGNDKAIPTVASSFDANGKEDMKFYGRRKGQTLLTKDHDFRIESTRERNSPIFQVKMMPDSQISSQKIPQNDEKMSKFLARFGMAPCKGGLAGKSADQF